jgi:hypothetical protein
MKRIRVALLVWVPALALSVALVGCGDKKEGGGGATEAKKGGGSGSGAGGGGEKKGPTAMMSGKGTLKGRITIGGDKPDLKALTAAHQQEIKKGQNSDYCLSAEAQKAGDTDQQEWKIDEATNGVKDVFVWLRPAKGTFFAVDATNPVVMAVKDKPLVIDQPHCAFHPHAAFAFPYYRDAKNQKVSTGQTIEAKNDATIAHNTQLGGSEENDKINVLLQPGKSVTIKKPEVDSRPIHVSCDIHKYMNANVWVVDNPYHAVTAKDGTFEIKNVPEGDVQLVVWHPGAGFVNSGGYAGEKITLSSGETTKDLTIKPSK